MKQTRRGILILTIATVLAGCGGEDITGDDGDPLAPEEAAAVLEVISAVLNQALFDFGGGAAATVRPAIPVNESFDASAGCPLGGSVGLTGRVTGDVAEDGSSGDLDFTFTETIRNCVLAHEATRFTVNGAPDLRYGGSLFFGGNDTDFVLNADFDLVGGIAYSASDGRAGTCRIEVNYEFTTNRIAVRGRVCGESINESVSF